ncbi:MAG: protein translocase subunit SecF [Myxococcales bacterium]|nr:protein translocase subunit SecF [Myxococcales bacterium]
MELIRPGTSIDFMGQTRICGLISVVLVSVSIGLMFVPGFKLGIDFQGGTVIEVRVPEETGLVDEGRVRQAASAIGFADAVIVRIGPPEDRAFRINVAVSEEQRRDLATHIIEGLSKEMGAPVVPQRIESVGPRVGRELRLAGLGALLLSWALILLYIWFRFDLRYAPGAVVALLHDVLITTGVFLALGLEFNLQVLAALLVVIGYSLNDTIVIYDRIRENLEERGTTHLEDVVNQSINQTLSRTVLTSMTTLFVVISLLTLGGPVLRDFALALLIGITVGTYSTIYIASALLIFLERRFGGAKSPTHGQPKGAKAKAKA